MYIEHALFAVSNHVAAICNNGYLSAYIQHLAMNQIAEHGRACV